MADLNPTADSHDSQLVDTVVTEPGVLNEHGAQPPDTRSARARALSFPFALPQQLSWPGLLLDLCLIALIGAGVYFRFSWTNWNQGTDLHPDEYGLTSTLTRLSIPKSLGDYFNTRLSTISPYQKYDADGNPTDAGPDNRMRWGQWPMTIIRWAAEASDNTGYGELRLLGRRLSALADTLSLIVLFLIGERLYNRRVGLLAAALSALAVMQIQQSHFMTVDNFAVLFTVLAMYCAVRVAQHEA
ncbi:MAG: glycosyltransferase family 39 protein, partial [Longimicrobiales bacterium]